jgi:hypothetical protein
MRTLSLNGMLTSLSTNYNRRNKNVKLYELANIYIPKQLPLTDYPDERMQLTFGFYALGNKFQIQIGGDCYPQSDGQVCQSEQGQTVQPGQHAPAISGCPYGYGAGHSAKMKHLRHF